MKHASTVRSRALNVPMGGRGSCTRRKYASAQSVTASDPTRPTTIWNRVAPGMSALLAGEGGLDEVRAHPAQGRPGGASQHADDGDLAAILGEQPLELARAERAGDVGADRELEVVGAHARAEAGGPALARERLDGLDQRAGHHHAPVDVEDLVGLAEDPRGRGDGGERAAQ